METPITSSAPSAPSKRLPIKQKVEAILFAVGSRISLQDITRLARSNENAVKEALIELKQKYDHPEHSLILAEDNGYWKLAVRDHYMGVVKKIVTETELSKTVLETLAVIAFKYPIKQSDLIHIRTNKAYDHLKELEHLGFISRKKHGRTNLIKLSEKFFQYFDLPEEKLKQHLADFDSIALAIGQKEVELHERKQQKAQELQEMKSKDEDIQKAIDTLDEQAQAKEPSRQDAPKLETYGEKESETEQKVEVGIYDVPPEEAAKESKPLKEPHKEEAEKPHPEEQPQPAEEKQEQPQDIPDEIPRPEPASEKEETLPETHFEGMGIMPTLAQEKEIDEKVEKILNPPKEKSPDDMDVSQDESGFEEELDRAKKRRHQK